MVGNTSRILQSAQALHIEWNAWKRPPIFDLIQHAGSVAEEEMRRVFNLGIGMIAIVPQTSLDAALGMLEGQNPVVIGSVTNAVS
jgi:phosphoribosylformylglycinamidine cyclo-ligase